jgi:hypothetical protein
MRFCCERELRCGYARAVLIVVDQPDEHLSQLEGFLRVEFSSQSCPSLKT